METGSLNVDLQPEYVRCTIKDKVTQLMLPEEILVEKSQVQRSTTTGALVVTCPKANFDELVAKDKRYAELREEREKKKKLEELNKPITKAEVVKKTDETLKKWE